MATTGWMTSDPKKRDWLDNHFRHCKYRYDGHHQTYYTCKRFDNKDELHKTCKMENCPLLEDTEGLCDSIW